MNSYLWLLPPDEPTCTAPDVGALLHFILTKLSKMGNFINLIFSKNKQFREVSNLPSVPQLVTVKQSGSKICVLDCIAACMVICLDSLISKELSIQGLERDQQDS